MSYLTFALKSIFYGGTIIGVGALLLKTTVPSTEDMRKKLEETGRANPNRDLTEEQKKMQILYKVLKENAASNRPAWDVRGLEELEALNKKQ
ncbi:hypothetical protein DFS34DRAFT_613251 [Phlyctochytrium arcticum]|nr:hypothetical protein DFS34DRAFT_613251 [Phlyctochytrium arcticum]